MKFKALILLALCFSLAVSSCKKDIAPSTPVSSNPNIINGCLITEIDGASNVNGGPWSWLQFHNFYKYDSLGRLLNVTDGEHLDTSEYHYHGHDCGDDHHHEYHTSHDGNLDFESLPHKSYQYIYDGDGYMQAEIFIDSFPMGNDDSYSKAYIWDNGNLTTVLTAPVYSAAYVSTYQYYTDKPYQITQPVTSIKGKSPKNLIKSCVITQNNQVAYNRNFSYLFDGQGKVSQYTDSTRSYRNLSVTTYTYTYQCH